VWSEVCHVTGRWLPISTGDVCVAITLVFGIDLFTRARSIFNLKDIITYARALSLKDGVKELYKIVRKSVLRRFARSVKYSFARTYVIA